MCRRYAMRNEQKQLIPVWFVAMMALASTSALFAAGPMYINDPIGDAIIRRTDWSNDGPIDPETQRLPDMIEMRLGNFQPDQPGGDLFVGQWNDNAIFLRFDLVFDGLINPPGPVAWDDDFPEYDPLRFGPNPVFGYVEFDMDADENTGGELEYPGYRYLGQVGRFGGVPGGAEFANHVAFDRWCNDHNVQTAPYIDRSGEEFHLVLRAEEIDYINVKVESSTGNPGVFEPGERWVLKGDFFHRAHGFEDYAFQCVDRPGRYKPEVKLQFMHDIASDTTTISLVYPLNNTASGQMQNNPPQSNDGCEDNQNSITEALTDLRWSAINASPWDMAQPEFQLIAGWSSHVVANYLDPTQWRITCLLGTAYSVQQSGSDRFIWTDIWPNVVPGDFDGDGLVDAADETLLAGYVAERDGDPAYDNDATVNGIVACNGFSRYFMLYDVNYDGAIDSDDLPIGPILGDMDISNVVDFEDVADFVLGLLDPDYYEAKHNGEIALGRGDFNGDGFFDAGDIQGFVELLTQEMP